MPARKFAISVPEAVMREVDRAAKAQRTTRSAFISEVLRRVARARSNAELSRRIDAVFADPALLRDQTETAAAYRSIAPKAGTEW